MRTKAKGLLISWPTPAATRPSDAIRSIIFVWAERRFRFRDGQTFALYVALYTFGRFFFELMRSDPATRLFGVRFNALLSAVLCITATAWFVVLSSRDRDARHSTEAATDLDAPTS